MKPKISVIIAARNEEECIAECLAKIPEYQGDLEVIVVDDASKDKTYEVVQDFKREVNRNVHVFRLERPHGNAYSWDYGVKKSTGELIFLLAADAEVNSFDRAVGYFQDEKVVQVIPKVEIDCKRGLVPKLLAVYQQGANYIPGKKKGLRKDIEKENPTVCDSHALMRKEFYLEVNAPTDKAAGEEYRFKELGEKVIRANGYRLVYEPGFMENREKVSSLRRFMVQQRFYGRNALAIFNAKDIYSYLKVIRRLLFISLLVLVTAFAYPILIIPIFILLLLRLFMGLIGIGREDVKYYFLLLPLVLTGDLAYDYGLIQSLIYRIMKGKWLITK